MEGSNWVLPSSLRTPILEEYDITEKIGEGGFSEVYKANRVEDETEVAIKHIQKEPWDPDWEVHMKLVRQEVASLERLGSCSNVVNLLATYEDDRNIFLVMQLIVDSCELFDILADRGWFNEQEAAQIIAAIVDALMHVHAHGVVHRDIKTENVMSNINNPADLCLIDFGLSALVDPANPIMTEKCGSPGYVAPEILLGEPYGFAVDMWSLGVTAYVLMAGFSPWDDESEVSVTDQIVNGAYNFDEAEWDDFTDTPKDFVTKLLQVDPALRISLADARKHPFLASIPVTSPVPPPRGSSTVNVSSPATPVSTPSSSKPAPAPPATASGVVDLITATHAKELADLRAKLEAEIEVREARHQAEISEKVAEHVREKEQFLANAELARKRAGQDLESEISKLEKKHEDVLALKEKSLEKVKETYEKELRESREKTELSEKNLREEMDTLRTRVQALALKASEREGEEDERGKKGREEAERMVKETQEAHAKTLRELTERNSELLARKMKEVEENHSKILKRQQEESEKALKSALEEKERELENQKSSFQSLLDNNEKEHKEKAGALVLSHNEHLQRIKEAQEKEQEAYVHEINKIHQAEITHLRQEKEKEQSELKSLLSEKEMKVEEKKAEGEMELQKMRQEMEMISLKSNEGLKMQAIEWEKKLADMKTQMESKFAQQLQEVEEKARKEAREKEQIKKEHEEAKMKEMNVHEMNALKAREVEDLKEELKKMKEARDEDVLALKNLQLKLTEQTSQKESDISYINARAEAMVNSMKEQSASELRQAQELHEKQIAELALKHKKDLFSATDELKVIIGDMERKKEDYTSQFEDLEKKNAADIEKHAQELEKVKAQFTEETAKIKAQLIEEQEKMKSQYEEEKEKLKLLSEAEKKKHSEETEDLVGKIGQLRTHLDSLSKRPSSTNITASPTSSPSSPNPGITRVSSYRASRSLPKASGSSNPSDGTASSASSASTPSSPVLATAHTSASSSAGLDLLPSPTLGVRLSVSPSTATASGRSTAVLSEGQDFQELEKKIDHLKVQNEALERQLRQESRDHHDEAQKLKLRAENLEHRLSVLKADAESNQTLHQKKDANSEQRYNDLQVLLSNTQLMLADKETENERLRAALAFLKSKLPKTGAVHNTCPSCNNINDQSAKFCSGCGNALDVTKTLHVPEEQIPQELQGRTRLPSRVLPNIRSATTSDPTPVLRGAVPAPSRPPRSTHITEPATNNASSDGTEILPDIQLPGPPQHNRAEGAPRRSRFLNRNVGAADIEKAQAASTASPLPALSFPSTSTTNAMAETADSPRLPRQSRYVRRQGQDPANSDMDRNRKGASTTIPFYAAKEAMLTVRFFSGNGKISLPIKIPFLIFYKATDEIKEQTPAMLPSSDIKAEVVDVNGRQIACSLTGGGSKFAVRFTPTTKGQHIVNISVRGVNHTLRSQVTGDTSTRSYIKGLAKYPRGLIKCTLVAVDGDGDAQGTGGDKEFTFTVMAPAGTVDKFQPHDNGDGTYDLSMVLLERFVRYQLHVKLKGEHISNSPFQFTSH